MVAGVGTLLNSTITHALIVFYAVPFVTNVVAAFSGVTGLHSTAINCHMHVNAEVCFFLEVIGGVQGYPTFLLCPPRETRLPTGTDNAEHSVRSLPERAQGLLHHLVGRHRMTFLELLRCHSHCTEPELRASEAHLPHLPNLCSSEGRRHHCDVGCCTPW